MSYEQQANYPNVYMLSPSSLPPFHTLYYYSPYNTALHFLPVLYNNPLARPAPRLRLDVAGRRWKTFRLRTLAFWKRRWDLAGLGMQMKRSRLEAYGNGRRDTMQPIQQHCDGALGSSPSS